MYIISLSCNCTPIFFLPYNSQLSSSSSEFHLKSLHNPCLKVWPKAVLDLVIGRQALPCKELGDWRGRPSRARAFLERLVGTPFGQVYESALCRISGSSSRGLQDSPRELPLYVVCRAPPSAVKYCQSSISSCACKTALYSLNSLYSDIFA